MKVDFYIGIALETLLDETREIDLRVFIKELTPMLSGNVDVDSKWEFKIKNAGTNPGPSMATTSGMFSAKYHGENANLERPSIHKGEQVLIMSFEGSMNLWWRPLGRNPEKRMTELYRILVANKSDPEYKLTDKNAYILEIDTRDKTRGIRVITNKNREEPFAYTLEINTEDGNMRVTDDIDNSLKLLSAAKTWIIKNAETEKTTMSPGKIVHETVDFTVKASNSITLDSPVITNTGDTTFKKTTTTTGAATFMDAVTMMANLNITGPVMMMATLQVVGGIKSPAYKLI